jgi:exodeoxyribonuclease VII large subunit
MTGGANPAVPVFSVSDFVAVVNQVVEYALPEVVVVGELANFKVSKGRWVYFDLKDDEASVRCFGTVYMLPGPLEDGMMLEVRGAPRLHPNFGFSLNVKTMRPVGEGSLRKAAELLQAKLTAEGLFDADRKRMLPYPPQRIGLISSAESAAYVDFLKILGARWGGVDVELADVQVQGERAPAQLVAALGWFNGLADPPEVLVMIRGGGSADDLAAFSDERVVRAVAASRVPTLVAIGHEVDVSLAELAADQRGSTPSNAAELLVPDRREALERLASLRLELADEWYGRLDDLRQELADMTDDMFDVLTRRLERERTALDGRRELVAALDPALALRRGFAVVRSADGRALRHGRQLQPDDIVHIELDEAHVTARVKAVEGKE